MTANPARDSARIGLARPWRRGGAAFGRAKAAAARLASLCPPFPTASAPPSENAENKKKTCRWEGLRFYARCSSGLLTTPPVCAQRGWPVAWRNCHGMPRACGSPIPSPPRAITASRPVHSPSDGHDRLPKSHIASHARRCRGLPGSNGGTSARSSSDCACRSLSRSPGNLKGKAMG